MASQTETTSRFILDNIGGADNIASVTHCATRLRFQLNDRSQANTEALDENGSVLGVVPQGDNGLQVVMGGAVANYFQELIKLPGVAESAEGGGNRQKSSKKEYGGVRGKFGWVDYAFEFLSDTFRPILWALLGASLIITILVLLDTMGIQDFRAENRPPTYQFMHAMYQSVFYFLPIMVGATAGRKLGANEWVGAAIPAALMSPEFMSLGNREDVVHVFGLPMVLNEYSGQVFPPLIAAIALYWVEKGLKKVIPEAVQMVFVPFFSLIILIPATAFLLGPFGIGLGNGISNALKAINDFSPFILSVVVPLLYPFIVPLGLHWPLNAVMIQNINSLGYDFIQGPMGAWNFACFGLVAGVLYRSFRERNKAMKQVSLGALMAGLLGGISEPSLYGIVLRFKKTYPRLLAGCFTGGVVMGIFNIKANAFVFTSILTIPAFQPWLGYTIGIAVAFFTSFFLVVFFDYRSKEEKEEVRAKIAADEEADNAAAANQTEGASASSAASSVPAGAAAGSETQTESSQAQATSTTTKKKRPVLTETSVLVAPLDGAIVPLKDVPDPAFAAGAVGHGVAIEPSGDTIYSPGDGRILAVQGHAIGVKLDLGVDLLVHVGVDTVEMKGANWKRIGGIVTIATGEISHGEDLLNLVPKESTQDKESQGSKNQDVKA
ncbi:MAG: PTS transporter subunit EIIC [Corynebacterium kroppenstedtii]|nr:PTS transporter subunit EIIC [Corynebacterium kroppenstedtii]